MLSKMASQLFFKAPKPNLQRLPPSRVVSLSVSYLTQTNPRLQAVVRPSRKNVFLMKNKCGNLKPGFMIHIVKSIEWKY